MSKVQIKFQLNEKLISLYCNLIEIKKVIGGINYFENYIIYNFLYQKQRL